MDSPFIIIMITIGVLVVAGIIVAVAAWRKRREINTQRTDYRAFFITGIVMIPVGIAGMVVAIATDISFVVAMPLITVGIIYMAMGLANRASWHNKQPPDVPGSD